MKRLNGLISVIAILSITACSSDPINTVSPTPENNTQTVSAQSVKGLTSFYNTIVDRTFNLLDKNKDKSVSLDEYMTRNTAGALPPGIQPQDVAVERIPGASPVDTKNLFIKVDKNKNGKVSLSEARNNSKSFIGVNKTQIRQIVAKSMFGVYNKDGNKVISKEEFFGNSVNTNDTKTLTLLSSLFYSSDKNKDKFLTFSEFEDFSYAMIQALWETPAAIQPTPTDPAQPSQPTQPMQPDQPVASEAPITQPDQPNITPPVSGETPDSDTSIPKPVPAPEEPEV